MESGVERGRHGRGLRLTFPYRGLQTRTARRTAQGGVDCRGGEAEPRRTGTARRTAQGGAAEARTAQGGAADVRMSREARWTSKCGGYGLGRARQRGNPTDPRQSFPPRVILSRPLSRRAGRQSCPRFPLSRPWEPRERFSTGYARVSSDYTRPRDYTLD